AIVDARPDPAAARAARERGHRVVCGTVRAVEGRDRVAGVHVEGPDGEATLDCDLVAVSGGWNPATQLWRAIGGALAYDEARACFVPDPAAGRPSWLSVV